MIQQQIEAFKVDMGLTESKDLKDLFEDYLLESNTLVEGLAQAINLHTHQSAKALAHNLKGLSANLYMTPVAEAAKILELQLEANRPYTTLTTHMNHLVRVHQQVQAGIRSYFSD